MLFIDNADELQNNDSTPYGSYTFLTDSLDWAFCDNKWVFRQFLKFYDCILDAVSYHVEEFRNVTWDEFEDAVKSKHTHLVNLEMFIYYSECDLPNGYYCFNESLMNDFHADTAEYDNLLLEIWSSVSSSEEDNAYWGDFNSFDRFMAADLI